MKIIEPSVELINAPSYETLMATIEAAGRTCYKSEDKITEGSAEKFIRGIIKLRNSPAAHPQMREVAGMLAVLFKDNYPVFFEDIEVA